MDVKYLAAEDVDAKDGARRLFRRRPLPLGMLAGLITTGLLSAALLSGCSKLAELGRDAGPPTPTPLAERPVGERLVGAYVYGGVWQGLGSVREVERAIGHTFDINHWFSNWDNRWNARMVALVANRSSLPLISWQNNRQSVQDIADGRHDAYIRSWARGVRSSRGEVYLRLFPEMNGDWVSWNGDPEALKRAWRRVVAIFRSEGADNARFVWSPNVTDSPRTVENRMENYYPGEAYVDVLALDGYNWGLERSWSRWTSFEEVFAEPYERVARLGPQPIWFAELASTEAGGDKGAWIREMLASRAFPRLEAVVWFSEDKGVDWRIQSSQGSVAAFREFFAATAQPSSETLPQTLLRTSAHPSP